MKSYFGIFKIQFKSELQYRGKAISGIITQFFWGLLNIYLYLAFMSTKTIEGFSISQMLCYIWLSQAFFALTYIGLPKNISKEIVNGDICYKFVRPITLYNQWYSEYLGEKLASVTLRCIPMIIIAFILPSSIALKLPTSVLNFILFLLSLLIGLLLSVSVSMIAIFLSLKTLMPKGAIGIVNVLSGLLGGLYIPLPFMPESLQAILNYLPFRYIADLPFRIYSGTFDTKTSFTLIGISLAWLIIMIILGKLLIKHSLKKVEVQGG